MSTSRLLLIISVVILAGLMFVGLLAWAPWITSAAAEKATIASFNKTCDGVIDGCGVMCNGCGVKSVRAVPFGEVVELEYACGLILADEPQYHEIGSYFVSPLGSVHELP